MTGTGAPPPHDRRLITILGRRRIADGVGVHRDTVMKWRARGRIPDRHRLKVWSVIEKEGLRFDKTAFVTGNRAGPDEPDRGRGDDGGKP